MAFVEVYDVDWRDAHTALGDVDLNAPGNSFTYEGITWRTPAVVDGNPVDQVVSTSWALESTGLHCVEPAFSGMTASNNNAPHIYATLPAIAANTATPFDADPTRQYIFQVYVSVLGLTPVNNEGAGVAIYKIDRGSVLGNSNIALSAQGRLFSASPINFYSAGVGALPNSAERDDISRDVPTVHYNGTGQRVGGYCADFGADWPDNDQLEFIGSYKDPTELENDVICDPPFFRVANFHNSPTNSSSYDSTIQRFRILQQQ